MPVRQTFTASRNATWAPPLTYDYTGGALPLAGARIDMQLRLYPGQPGSPKLALPNIPFIDEMKAGTADGLDEVRTLTLSPKWSRAQLSGLPGLHTPEAGDPQRFVFDIRISYADGSSEILSEGEFNLFPGVTV